jgi:hypothetical protein
MPPSEFLGNKLKKEKNLQLLVINIGRPLNKTYESRLERLKCKFLSKIF